MSQVVVRLDDQVVLLILAEQVDNCTERLDGQCTVAVHDRHEEDVVMEITLLEESSVEGAETCHAPNIETAICFHMNRSTLLLFPMEQ